MRKIQKHYSTQQNRCSQKGKDNTLPSHGSEKDLANKSATFFESKIATIRETFPGSIINQFEQPLSNNTPESFENFENISESNLEKLISYGNSKTSSLDPIPTSLLKVLPVLLPTIHTIVNKSLQSSQMPHHLKRAIVKPIIKKSTLDPENMKNYRPVSNLAYICKIIEKVVVAQLDAHLTDNDLHEPLQSAYRTSHSTETALLKVSNDILLALDKRQCVYLVLLDLSAPFDTIDHTVFVAFREGEWCNCRCSGVDVLLPVRLAAVRQHKLHLIGQHRSTFRFSSRITNRTFRLQTLHKTTYLNS